MSLGVPRVEPGQSLEASDAYPGLGANMETCGREIDESLLGESSLRGERGRTAARILLEKQTYAWVQRFW